MAAKTDDLAARRWFRQRLQAIARQYPALTTPAAQERLTAHLDPTPREESDRCPDAPPADPQADR